MTGLAKLTKTFILFLTVLAIFSIAGIDIANACGWGQGGGQSYVPQRRDSKGFMAQKQALTEEQARDIVTKYVKRLNPNLEVGNLKDNGSFYEAEIIAEDNEVIQLVGIDKRSGRLIVLN